MTDINILLSHTALESGLGSTTATVNTSTNPNTHTYVNIYQVLRLTFLYWPESGTRADNLGRGDT